MKNSFKKTLSLVIALVIAISSLSVSVLASENTDNINLSLSNYNLDQEKPNIVNEIISERTSNSKVFSTDDGGYYTVLSVTPIHILDEDGEFQNIEEPTEELNSEETISEYIAKSAETYNELSQLSTYSSGIGEDDILGEDEISFSILCWDDNSKTIVNDGHYYVQGTSAGNRSVIIQPSYNNWDTKSNIIITSAKLSANGSGSAATSNNIVVAKKIDKLISIPTDIEPVPKLDLYNYYFDALFVSKSDDELISFECEWDITNILNEWLLGNANNGFALSTLKNKKKCNVELNNFHIGYYYHEINNTNDMLSYETIDMGLAGTFYIEHFSRNIIMEHDDIGIHGEKAPVSIKQTYNPLYSNESSTVGQNFHLNYFSSLEFSNSIYTFYAPNGDTIKLYKQSTNNSEITYTDSQNTYTLKLYADKANGNFIYNKYENITITTNEGETYYFETHHLTGFLNKIEDSSANKNAIIISYSIENDNDDMAKTNWIQKIIDGADREYVFTYASYLGKHFISNIVAKNEDGDTITVGNGNEEEEYKVEYEYIISNNQVLLSEINHVGTSENIKYYYDNNNRLIKVMGQNKCLILTYESDSLYAISNYKITSLDEEIIFEYIDIETPSVYQRIFTTIDGEEKIINYDYSYNMTYYKDYDDTVIFGTTKNENEYYINALGQQNLIVNGDFSEKDDSEPLNWDCNDAEITMPSNGTLGIKGDFTTYCRVFQMVKPLDGKTTFNSGESYAYGGKAVAENALVANENRSFGIYIFDAKNEGSKLIPNQCISYFNFDETISKTEQEKLSYFTLQQDTDALFVYLCFDYNYDAQYAYFDDIKLFEYEPFNNIDPVEPYTYEHNNNDSILSVKLKSDNENSSSYLATLYGYDDSCNLNYISEIDNEKGIKTYYKYDPDNGRLISTSNDSTELNSTAAKSFEYTASGLLSSVKQTVTNTITGNVVEMETEYAYSYDMLTSVTHNGFSYNFVYDAYGNITSIGVSTQETPLVTTTYVNARKCLTDTITYANGCQIDYTYDIEDTDRITKIDYIKPDGTIFKSLQYNYDAEGNLSSAIDEKANVKIAYNENSYSYILTDNNNETVLYQSNVDDTGNTVETFTQGMNGATTTVISYPSNVTNKQIDKIESNSKQTLNRVESVDGVDKNINYSFDKSSITDEFDRLQSSKINSVYQIGSDSFAVNSEDTYTYKSNGDREFTLVDSYTTVKSIGERNENGTLKYNNGEIVTSDHYNFTFNYSYDSSGNITKVHLTDNVNNTFVNFLYSAYKYDNANQLIFEYSPTKNCCIAYDYDAGGNIIEKRVYNLSAYDQTNDTILSSAQYESIVFSYDPNYKDRLISVNNAPIQYDSLGNPINYDPANGFFEWNGRLLTAFETNNAGNRYEYEYDEQGLRVRKIIYDKKLVAGTTDEYTYEKTNSLEYIWDNGKLKGVSFTNTQTNTSSFMNLIYDEAGIAQGYIGLSGNPYYFVRDALGNVVYVISPIDDLSITVFYDAWGNPTLQSSSYDDIGMQIATLFIYYFNPSTYKGYLYDYETGLYYCQSRYYSPVWSRFINMDDVRILNLTQGDTLGNNLYAYCNNNPVNYIDTTGYWAEKYPGFEWTNNGFKLSVHPNFLKKSFCLEYAADILAIVKSNKYKSMSQKRMAVELYFHAAIYYIMDPFVVLGLNGALINKLHTSAKMMDINNNDYRVVFFYLVWNSL